MQREGDQSCVSRPAKIRLDNTEIIEAEITTFFYSAVAIYSIMQSMKNVPQLCHYSADSHQSGEMNALTAV